MTLAVVGLGLIGGSLALATGARGFDADPAVRAHARARGIDVRDDLAAAVRDAELVVGAVPSVALASVIQAVLEAAPDAVVTDTASLKRPLAALSATLPPGARVVGGHPMAGSTRSGIAAADAGLFRGRRWLIVPTARTDAQAAALVGALARSVGAETLVVSAERHDALMTWMSQLPLAAASALASVVAREGTELAAGPGLLDTTRIAGTPEALALELLTADRGALAFAIEELGSELAALVDTIRSGEDTRLRAYLSAARGARDQLERPRLPSTEK